MIHKIIIGVIAVVTLSLGAVAGAAYLGLISFPFWLSAADPEDSARLYPPDAVAYSWMTISPGIGQLRHAGDILSRLEDLSEFDRLRDEAADEFEDSLGLDFEDDVMTWLGSSASFAVLDIDINEEVIEMAATLEVRDRAAAEDALKKLMDFMENERGMAFARESEGDFAVWADESANEFYALSDDLMIFATTRSAIRDVARRYAGETDRTLAASERFQQARSAMRSPRFMSAYVDLESVMDSVWASASEFGGAPYADADLYGDCMSEFFPTPDWTAGSARWVERGVAFDLVAPSTASLNMPDAPPLADAAAILPSDTLGFMAFSFDPLLDNWRAALADYSLQDLADCLPEDYGYLADSFGVDMNGDLSDLLDDALDALNAAIGADIESDFLNNLGGQMAIAVGEFDFGAVSENPEQAAIRAAAALSLREGADGDLQDVLDDLLQDAYYDYGLELQEADVGADRPAMIYPIEGTRYAPGAVVSGGYLTFATTLAALRDMSDVQAGREPALSSDPEYARAISHLPAERQWTLYINLRRVMDGIDRGDMDMTREQIEALETVAGAIAISAGESDGFDRSTVVLTLFGEDGG